MGRRGSRPPRDYFDGNKSGVIEIVSCADFEASVMLFQVKRPLNHFGKSHCENNCMWKGTEKY